MKRLLLIIILTGVVWGCLGVGNLSPLSPFLLREVPARMILDDSEASLC